MRRPLTILISLVLLGLLAACGQLEPPVEGLDNSPERQAILSPFYAIGALIDDVTTLDLTGNTERPLLSLLVQAQNGVERGNTQAALSTSHGYL